jgi:DNA-binding HxlR family transcriptional regulator
MGKAPNVKVEFTEIACIEHLKPVRDALFVFGGKWKLQIIIVLRSGNKRFSELQRTIEGISSRVLSNELKDLELNKFVKRSLISENADIYEYEITEYSDTLKEVLMALGAWGRMHRGTLINDK